MKKRIKYATRGHRADIGPFQIYRLLSNNYQDHIGHFVFMDYISPIMMSERQLNKDAAHPHRGIATITYLFNGEAKHYDSRGHQGTVYSGGVQWMKAGTGIVHNEAVGPDSKTHGKLLQGFQFWLNLPAQHKKENPDYMAVQSEELPLVPLDNAAGSIKVVVGEYAGQASKIPIYAQQYLYHVKLEAGKSFLLPTSNGLEYAAFLPQQDLTVNGSPYHSGDLIGFDDDAGEVEFTNHLDAAVEFIIFGGEKYTEPFVAQGPFVMSSQPEIRQAHADYLNGKYGQVVYD